jgi:hypothetical protein
LHDSASYHSTIYTKDANIDHWTKTSFSWDMLQVVGKLKS